MQPVLAIAPATDLSIRRLTPSELQSRLDRHLLRHAPWVATLAGLFSMLELSAHLRQFPRPIAVWMSIFASAIGVTYIMSAYASTRITVASPRVRHVALLLLLLSLAHSLLRLHALGESEAFAGPPILMIVGAMTLTAVAPYLVLCMIGLLGTIPFAATLNPSDEFDTYTVTIFSFVCGLAILQRRLVSMRKMESMAWEEEQLRERLQSTIVRMEQEVVERHSAEESMRQQREQLMHVSRLASLGEMLAAIAHEVHQPLYAISNFASASAQVVANETDPALVKLKRWNERIIEQTTRASEIIQRLRSLAQRTKPQRTVLNVASVIEESLALMRPLLAASEVETCVPEESDRALVCADRVLVEQVLMNLIRNACEAMSAQNDCVRQLTISARRRDREAELAVEDTGVGLEEDDLAHVFEPFVSTKAEGLGLGLAISRSIVEAHGGTIWAERLEQQGVAIRFTLPLAEQG